MSEIINTELEKEWIRRISMGEGFSPTPRPDPAGNGYCVGYGHNLNTSGHGAEWIKSKTGKDINHGEALTQQDAEIICKTDLKDVYNALNTNLPWWKDLDPESQYVMVDTCYTMGIDKLKGFKNMLGALRQGDYKKASEELLGSKYAKQTGQRARKNAELLRTGVWSDNDPKVDKNLQNRPTRQKGQDITKQRVLTDSQKANNKMGKVGRAGTKQYRHKETKVAEGPSKSANDISTGSASTSKESAQKAILGKARSDNNISVGSILKNIFSKGATGAIENTINKSSADTQTSANSAPKSIIAKGKPKPIQTNAASTKSSEETSKTESMRNMLEKMNQKNEKNHQIDVDGVIEAFTQQFGENADKVLIKALMAPAQVARNIGLTDEKGNPVQTPREVIQQLGKVENKQQNQQVLKLIVHNRLNSR